MWASAAWAGSVIKCACNRRRFVQGDRRQPCSPGALEPPRRALAHKPVSASALGRGRDIHLHHWRPSAYRITLPGQPIDRRPSRGADPAQKPPMALLYPTQRHHRHSRPMRQGREPPTSQRLSPGVRSGREQGGQKDQIRPHSLRRSQLAGIMHRHAVQQGPHHSAEAPPMPAIRAPCRCLPRWTSKQHNKPPPPGNRGQSIEQGSPLGFPRPIMAENHPSPASRQARGRLQQRLYRDPFIGHQPDRGQIFSVAGSHAPRL
jgi:hypothetical protein